MGQNLFLILILVSAAWQILGSVLEKRAKEAKKRQLEEAGRRSRGHAGGAAESGERTRSPQRRTTMAGPVEAGGRPGDAAGVAETIDARRRAQIEELRRRALERARGSAPARSSGGASGRTSMADAGRKGSSPTPEAVPGRGSRSASPRPEVARDWAELDQRRATERAAKDQAVRRRNLKEAADQRRRDIETQARRRKAADEDRREAAAAAASARRSSSTTGSQSGRRPSSPAGFGRGDRIRGLVRDRQALRDLLVLREIMDPPVSMRTSPIPADRVFEG